MYQYAVRTYGSTFEKSQRDDNDQSVVSYGNHRMLVAAAVLTITLAMSTNNSNNNGVGTNGIASPPAKWSAEELMHGKDGVEDLVASAAASLTLGSPGASATGSPSKKSTTRFTMRKLGGGKSKPPADPMDWGMPGHLTEEEVAIFVSSHYFLGGYIVVAWPVHIGRRFVVEFFYLPSTSND